jgi:integrase
MTHGSTSPPRRVPRSQTTVRLYTGWALPALDTWAANGHRSLREIAAQDVLAVLPPQGTDRAQTCRALRSIFTLLRQHKLVFADPTSRIHAWVPNAGQPLPVDTDLVSQALEDPNPARAAVASLVCFHGLRVGDLRALQLGDLRDGRLRVGDRVVVLAEPVATRLGAWIAHRTLRWPHTPNAHLFIHFRSATRAEPVGHRWVKLTLNLPGSVQALREDRILHEAHGTGGDARRLHDFFGLSIQAALRYTATVDHPDLIDGPAPGRLR